MMGRSRSAFLFVSSYISSRVEMIAKSFWLNVCSFSMISGSSTVEVNRDPVLQARQIARISGS